MLTGEQKALIHWLARLAVRRSRKTPSGTNSTGSPRAGKQRGTTARNPA